MMNEISNQELLIELQRRLLVSEQTITQQQDMLSQMTDLNKRLELSEALKGHFISNIKNEINNPLASILALSQNLMRKQNVLPGDVVKGLRLIYNEAHALDFQLDNIMTAAEIEAGHVAPQLVDTNVSHVIDHVLSSFSNLIEKKKLDIQLKGDDHIHFVTDTHYFKIIAANLISNAIKFSVDGGTITITILHAIDRLALNVSDSGNGIQQQDLTKIFDRFTQLDSGTVKKYQGHGLGLSVIKDLVESLDGTISVKSGVKGSVFSIELPVKLSDDGISTALDGGDEILFDQSF